MPAVAFGSAQVAPEISRPRSWSLSGSNAKVRDKAPVQSLVLPHILPTATSIPETLLFGSNEDAQEYDRLRRFFKWILIIGNVFGLVAVALLLYWIFKVLGGMKWTAPGTFGIHILFMTLFMFLAQGQASIIYRILPSLSKETLKYIHAGMHGVVSVGIAVGLASIVQNYDLQNKNHFYSLHSWIGIGAIALYYLQFLFSVVTYLLPLRFIPWSFRTKALPLHIYSGQLIFSFCCVSTITGIMMTTSRNLGQSVFEKKSLGNYPYLIILNTAGLLTIVYACLTVDLLLDFRFRRRPRPPSEDEDLLSITTGGHRGSRVGANIADVEVWTDHLNA